MSESDLFAPCDSNDPLEHFWTAVLRGWDIEPRAYFEKEAVAMGFKSPVEMAVHYMWKRRVLEDAAAVPPPPREESANDGVALIAAERERQRSVEGWTPDHDDYHLDAEMIEAARAYLSAAVVTEIPRRWLGPPPPTWPWNTSWWKPSDDPIRNLVKAGALIAAEIDRLRRAARPVAAAALSVSPQEPQQARMLNDYADLLELLGRELHAGAEQKYHRGFSIAQIRAAAAVPVSPQEEQALDLEPIKARCDAATHGPWEYERLEIHAKAQKRDGTGPTEMNEVKDTRTGRPICGFASTRGKYEVEEANGLFVAHARMDVPNLAREVERLRAAAVPSPPREEPAALETALERQIQMALRAMDMAGMTDGQKAFYEGKAAGVRQALNSVRIAAARAAAALPETPAKDFSYERGLELTITDAEDAAAALGYPLATVYLADVIKDLGAKIAALQSALPETPNPDDAADSHPGIGEDGPPINALCSRCACVVGQNALVHDVTVTDGRVMILRCNNYRQPEAALLVERGRDEETLLSRREGKTGMRAHVDSLDVVVAAKSGVGVGDAVPRDSERGVVLPVRSDVSTDGEPRDVPNVAVERGRDPQDVPHCENCGAIGLELTELMCAPCWGNDPEGPRFHWRDGWFFQRVEVGVLMTLPDRAQKVIPADEWESILKHLAVPAVERGRDEELKALVEKLIAVTPRWTTDHCAVVPIPKDILASTPFYATERNGWLSRKEVLAIADELLAALRSPSADKRGI